MKIINLIYYNFKIKLFMYYIYYVEEHENTILVYKCFNNNVNLY